MYMPFALNIAVSAAKSLPIETDDAIQFAYEGLIEAAQRYDPTKYDPTHESGAGEKHYFKAYAHRRIFGKIVDEARKATFVKRRGLEKGLNPNLISLDETFLDGDVEVSKTQVADIPADLDFVCDFEAAFDTLSPKEQRILLASGAGITGEELASEYGVTASRISQIKAEAKDKIEELVWA